MAHLISVIYTILCITVSWQYCNAQQEDFNLDENKIVHKSVKNHFNDMGVQSKFLNLKNDNPKQQGAKGINHLSTKDKNLYDKDVKISKTLGIHGQLDTNKMQAKRDDNKYKYYHRNENSRQNFDDFDINKKVGNRQPMAGSVLLKGNKRLKNKNKPRMFYNVSKVSETDFKALSNNRKLHKPTKREHNVNLVINNLTTEYEIRPEMKKKFNPHLQYINDDTALIRNERDNNRRHQLANIYAPKISKKSRDSFENVEEKYNPYDMEQQLQNHYRPDEENKQHFMHDSKSDMKQLYDSIKDKINKIKPDYHPEKVFDERSQLSYLSGEASENFVELKGQTKTTYSCNTTKEETTTPCTTENSIYSKTTPKLFPTNISQSTIKTYSVNHLTNISQEEATEHERFLRGQLADDFVKQVLTKVARARKIMLELGFNNDTDESCERCAELIPSDVPELEDMRKSVEMLSTEDTMTCYKIPVEMDKYLSLLLPHKRANKNSVTNKGEEDNFIFKVTEFLSELEGTKENKFKYSSQDVLLKNSFEKQRLSDESIEEINGGQISNVHDSNPSSDSYTKIPKNIKPRQNKVDGQDNVNNLMMKDYFKQPQHQSNNNKDAIHETEQHSCLKRIDNEPSEILDSNSFKDSRNIFLAHSHKYNNVFEPLKRQLDDKRELGQLVDRNARTLKNEKENIEGLPRSQFGEEYEVHDRPEIKFRSWSRSNLENRNLKNKDDSFPYSNSMHHERGGRYFNNENHNVGADHMNKPQLSTGSWQHEDEHSRQSQDLDDSQVAIPYNRMYYDDDTRILKRDTQPPSEGYSDDDSIFHEFSDMEYDLY